MKNILISFFSIFLSTTTLFSQGKIAQKDYQHFEPDDGGWVTDSREHWEYDQVDRETLYTTWTSYQGDFAPYNNTRLESVYHSNGLLKLQKSRSWGDTLWQENLTTYQYNAADDLHEIINKNEGSETETISYQRSVYETDLATNSRTYLYYYSMNAPENWIFQYQRDSFYDENDCLIKQSIFSYNDLGEKINERCTTYDVNESCQLQMSGYWLDNASSDSIFLYTRHNFSYSNDDKTQTDIYQKRPQSTSEWQTQHLVEKTVDEAGREIYYFYENYKPNHTDTLLKLTTYTEKGELETIKEYRASYQFSDNPLRITRFDSLAYQYDEEGKLLRKDQFIQHYSNPIQQFTTHYDYYCNGQLKTEKSENLPTVSRIRYQYYGNADCPLLENEQPNLTVFPNPSDGSFTIQSNLLATAEAEVAVYSVVGQLMFTQKIDRIAPTFNLELSALPRGSYVLTIRNAKESLSEKVVIR